MKNKKLFLVFITSIISIFVLIIIVNLVITNTNINQGRFRVSDVILTSTVKFNDKLNENKAWSFDISQQNLLSILITPAQGAETKRIYLSDIQSKGRKPITVLQLNSEMKKTIGENKESLELEWKLSDKNQILLELVFLNEKILENWMVPEGIKEIRRDGTIFKTANISLVDIQTIIEFKLNIEEASGKINTMQVNLKVPNEELVNNGHDIRRLKLSDFFFRVK